MQREKQPDMFVVREYDAKTDRSAAEAVERTCEAGTPSIPWLHMDFLGDPAARIRHSPVHLMLMAETISTDKEIVGIVRGCIKIVVCGKKTHRDGENMKNKALTRLTTPNTSTPVYTKVGYILGLRVLPIHRRRGIGLKLVRRMEEWFKEKEAEYAYMATEKDNEASICLFTGRCGYTKFRTPSILVHPVFAHHLAVSRSVFVFRVSPGDAEVLYRRRCAAAFEFFPRDIDAVLVSPLTVGTLVAVPAAWASERRWRWPGAEPFLASPPTSWAVASVWDCGGAFRLQVRGASRLQRAAAAATRAADRAAPWLGIPSVPDLFRPFGVWFVYGIGGEGPEAAGMARAAWREAHNGARGRSAVVAAEVAAMEPLRAAMEHWRWMSCPEDLWCAKRLAEDYGEGAVGDWTKSSPWPSIFVDPRDL